MRGRYKDESRESERVLVVREGLGKMKWRLRKSLHKLLSRRSKGKCIEMVREWLLSRKSSGEEIIVLRLRGNFIVKQSFDI